jgi:sporulation protein YlmC with PRC-barrel domain
LQVDTNTNIIQSLKVEPESKEEISQTSQQKKLPDRLSQGDLSMDNAVNALNDAILVRDMMESRNEQLKAITGD